MPRPSLSQVAPHQNDRLHGNRRRWWSDGRTGGLIDKSMFDGIRKIPEADELAIVVAHPPQGDVRLKRFVPYGEFQAA